MTNWKRLTLLTNEQRLTLLFLLITQTIIIPVPCGGSFMDMAAMMMNLTSHSPAEYACYGKNCGFGGLVPPIDEVDRCCYKHDLCYSFIDVKKLCGNVYEIFIPYRWKLNENNTNELKCDYDKTKGDQLDCFEFVCECDIALVTCLKDQESHFRQTNLRLTLWVRKKRNIPEMDLGRKLRFHSKASPLTKRFWTNILENYYD